MSTAPPNAGPPGPHPEPAEDLAQRPLPLRVMGVEEPLFRIHSLEREPLHFSHSGSGRFDAPNGEYGVLYAGTDAPCAFIETFGRELGYRLVTRVELEVRGLAQITPSRPLPVVDLTGPGLGVLRADGRLCTGDYRVAQRWSLALWRHPDQPDGLLWRSRFDPSRTCVAIYERVRDALRAVSLGSLAHPRHSTLLADVLDTYGFGLIELE